MDYTFLKSWLEKSPKWAKALACLIAAAAAILYLCTSCSTIQSVRYEKRMTRETRDTTHLLVTTIATRNTVRAYGVRKPALDDNGAKLVVAELPLTNEVSIGASANAESCDYLRAANAARSRCEARERLIAAFDCP